MRRLKHLIAVGALVLAATPALGATFADPAPPASVSGVTVTAQKPNPTVNSASEFVRLRMPESPMTGQYARFKEPICVWVQGLPDQFDSFIEKRILKLAAEVNAPVSRNPLTCVANVQVIFTPYPEKLLFNIGRKRVLNLMAEGCLEDPPHAVTSGDVSLLKALYAVNPRESGSQQRIEIADRLSKANAEPPPATP